jgi:hypothetical protein
VFTSHLNWIRPFHLTYIINTPCSTGRKYDIVRKYVNLNLWSDNWPECNLEKFSFCQHIYSHLVYIYHFFEMPPPPNHIINNILLNKKKSLLKKRSSLWTRPYIHCARSCTNNNCWLLCKIKNFNQNNEEIISEKENLKQNYTLSHSIIKFRSQREKNALSYVSQFVFKS